MGWGDEGVWPHSHPPMTGQPPGLGGGLGLTPHPSLCTPQPDLGAGGREGELLAILHHGDGRRHEHLGRQGEVSPWCSGPPPPGWEHLALNPH